LAWSLATRSPCSSPGGFTIAAHELDELYQSFPFYLDAACFVLPDPIVGDRIFGAVVPKPSEAISRGAAPVFDRARHCAVQIS
jgi:non-ribosomal peptide synthetase component E (peptide arylation enzyme)